jgi:hypothetical protein
MTNQIEKQLEQHRKDIENLIDQYSREKQVLTSYKSKAGRESTSDGIGALIEIATSSKELKKHGKRVSKAALEDQHKKSLKEHEDRYLRLLRNKIAEIKALLSEVSTLRIGKPIPNTNVLLRRIERINERITFKGKANKLIQTLSWLQSKKLVRNAELEQLAATSKRRKQVIIKAGTPYSAKREVEKVLESARTYVCLIDTYIDEKTLDVLLAVPKEVQILVITQGRTRWPSKRFLQQCKDFAVERPGFEIRVADSRLIHDRFLLTDGESCLIGSSLKDFGKSMSSMTILEKQASQNAHSEFQAIWQPALKLKDI